MSVSPTLLDQDLVRAAEILAETAQSLRESNAVGNRQWAAQGAYGMELVNNDHAAHDEMMRLAGVLRRHATYLKPNPLGGPAKVFDAIAGRIRAGEDYHEVLADYGLFQTFASKKRWKKSK